MSCQTRCPETLQPVFLFLISLSTVTVCSAAERCYYGNTIRVCQYGCCGSGTNQTCCPISTSVLIIICVVSGMIVIALVASIGVCWYKSYKDKQTNRVRQLQQDRPSQERRRIVSPPKPPRYTPAPPEYSEEMPDSHFRPQTVSDFMNMNTRYHPGNTPRYARHTDSSGVPGTVSVTQASGTEPHSNTNNQRRSRRSYLQVADLIPEDGGLSPPPPYREHPRGQTPGNRHRRFIRTPAVYETASASTERQHNSNTVHQTDINVHRPTPEPAGASDASVTETQPNSESRADISRTESRAEVVMRVLQPSRLQNRTHDISGDITPVSGSQRRSQSSRNTVSEQRTARDEGIEELIHI